jgi:hypothetical protein
VEQTLPLLLFPSDLAFTSPISVMALLPLTLPLKQALYGHCILTVSLLTSCVIYKVIISTISSLADHRGRAV